MDNEKKELSLRKILVGIIVIIALCHLGGILEALQSIYEWFGESLSAMNDFPKGARAAIAMVLIVLVVVIIFKKTEK